MRSTTVALAAALAFAGFGPALAQTNDPSINQPTTHQTTPARQTTGTGPSAATVQPSSSATQNPKVNPSAAGTQRGWNGYGSSAVSPSVVDRSDQTEHADSKPGSANTHPLGALLSGQHSNRTQQPAQRPPQNQQR